MARTRFAQLALATVLLAVTPPAGADGWSRFRGPNGSGVSLSSDVPTEFGPGSHELWTAPVPFGRSSPVIGDGKLFVSAVEDGKLVTLAFDVMTGDELWRRELEPGHGAELHQATDSATPTPVTDGKNVYVFFHEAGLVSYDASGTERWRFALGPFRNYYGCASSPVVAQDLVLVICDQAQGSFLLAVDAATGKQRWRNNRPARLEGYATPILYPNAAAAEMVLVSGSRWVDAYDLATGKSVWALPGVGTGPVASPVLVGDTLFVCAHDHAEHGWPAFEGLLTEHDKDGNGELTQPEVAEVWLSKHFGWLDTDASGTIAADDWQRLREELVNDSWGINAIKLPAAGGDGDRDPEILWNYRQNVPYIPSPMVYDGVFYMVKDSIVSSLDPKSGKLLKRGRLDGGGKVHASPVAADGKVFISTLSGQIAVLGAGAEWKVIATNELGEPIHASPAILDGRIYVLTESKLYAFGAAKKTAETPASR